MIDLERWRPRAPYLLVAAAVLFGLVAFRAELSPPVHLNDSGMHLSMARWAADRLRDGHNPFDGWYPYLGLGFPQTHHYQSLPHVLTAVVGLVTGVKEAYDWSLYLLLAGWPVAVYAGARLLDLDRTSAACAALVCPFVVSTTNYGYEAGSYTWAGYGIWPQLWAMWLLPITIGLAHRALQRRVHVAWPAAALAATIACHFITGWVALAMVGLLPLLDIRRIKDRAIGMARIMAGGIALVAWVLLPLWLDGDGADYTGYGDGNVFNDSFGARKVLGWLVRGELFDTKRFPVLTLLAAAGLGVTVWRARARVGDRVVLLLGALSLLLFFGRPTWGALLDLMPLGSELFYPRFILGVHLAGVLLAGTGLAATARYLTTQLSRLGSVALAAAVVAVLVFIALFPAVSDRWSRERSGRALISAQDAVMRTDGADFDRLLARIPADSGRVYAGTAFGWGRTYLLGFVPGYAMLLDRDVESVGFLLRVSSLGTMAEEPFNETNPADFGSLGVRWLIHPDAREPTVPATLVAIEGRHHLYSVDTPAYGEVVDAPTVADADAETLRSVGRVASASPFEPFRTAPRPLIRWHGEAGEPTAPPGAGAGLPGSVTAQDVDTSEGRFDFDVDAERDSYLAVSTSWHPRLQATVDGEPADVVVIAPGTAAVHLEPGEHVVKVWYRPFQHTIAVVALGIAAFLAVTGLPPFRRRRRVASQSGKPLDRAEDDG